MAFWEAWNDTELGLREPISEPIMRSLFYKQIDNVPCLQLRLTNYKLARNGDQIKTYINLRTIGANYLDDVLMQKIV